MPLAFIGFEKLFDLVHTGADVKDLQEQRIEKTCLETLSHQYINATAIAKLQMDTKKNLSKFELD